jgi:ADP-heptose:LPS heptosyltransferase
MANACPWIDETIVDPGPGWRHTSELRRHIRRLQFDAVITLFSTTRIGWVAFSSRIPCRVVPATKLAQVFYNCRLTQRRSQSAKPEYVYNMDLVKHFLAINNLAVPEDPKPPFLEFDSTRIQQLKRSFCEQHGINPNHKLLFVHPGSGGSANSLSLKQFATLAREIKTGRPHTFVVTAGPGEMPMAQELSTQLTQVPHVVYESAHGLRRFAEHIQFADLFVSGSTGPLHIAGALNIPTAAFYTRRRSATPLRWQTLNSPDRRLAYTPPPEADELDMSSIDVTRAAAEISEKLLS